MLRLRPLFWATFLPGSSTVPAALAVIFRTRSFSSLYTPWLLARPVASLCRKSLRTLASCIRSRDIFPFSLCQLDENLTLRASLCCSFASLSRMPSKALTGSISWPTEVAANTATPRSMPIGSSVDFDGSGLFFCHKTLTNHSPAFRRIGGTCSFEPRILRPTLSKDRIDASSHPWGKGMPKFRRNWCAVHLHKDFLSTLAGRGKG